MNLIDKLPNFNWSPSALEEITATGREMVEHSDFAYQIGQVAICGLIYRSYLSPPWFWFALAEGVTLRDLIDFRRTYMEMIPSGALTAINENRRENIRFAEFYGFEDTGLVRLYKGVTYKIYRRI